MSLTMQEAATQIVIHSLVVTITARRWPTRVHTSGCESSSILKARLLPSLKSTLLYSPGCSIKVSCGLVKCYKSNTTETYKYTN